MSKVLCNTCKYCSDVIGNKKISCNANCQFNERPAYIKYMKELKIENETINPVTGEKNESCDCKAEYDPYGYHELYIDPTPARYLSCSKRNKNFNCGKYKQTGKIIYVGIDKLECPYCKGKLDLLERYSGCGICDKDKEITGYHLYCENKDCYSEIDITPSGKIIEFDYSGARYHITGSSSDLCSDEKYKKRQRNKELVNARIRFKLGLIDEQHFKTSLKHLGCFDDGKGYIILDEPKKGLWHEILELFK